MCHRIASALVGLTLVFAVAVPVAWADLERVGPVNAANGYPEWYQDRTGLALELGTPINQAELDGGWNLILPADVPNGTAPETFPGNFSEEHFYWSAEALMEFTIPPDTRGRALLVLALEAAFNQGPAAAGDQAVFGRLRVRVEPLPASGTYRAFTPYGTFTFPDQVAGDRLFFTSDIGLGGGFEGALASQIGPFLIPSSVPGGAELAAIPGPVPGKLYLSDPGRVGPVTGSPIGQNFFRIEGPGGFLLETSNFTVTGRVFTGAIPSNLTVDRASVTRTAAGQKVDVFSTALPSTPSRLPAGARPAPITPVLSFFNAPPTTDPATGRLTAPPGEFPNPMFGSGTTFWGQSQPPAVPTAATVEDEASRDATGVVVPTFIGANVGDQVTVTNATFDPVNGRLTVAATSSDQVVLHTLTLDGFGELRAGQIVVTPLVAPPTTVRILSTGGGVAERQVTTLFGIPTADGIVPPPDDGGANAPGNDSSTSSSGGGSSGGGCGSIGFDMMAPLGLLWFLRHRRCRKYA